MKSATKPKWYLAAAAIGLSTIIVDLSTELIVPLAVYVLAATMVWVKAPEHVAPFAILLSTAILLPGIINADDWAHWLCRIVTVGCLLGVTCLLGMSRYGVTDPEYPTDL